MPPTLFTNKWCSIRAHFYFVSISQTLSSRCCSLCFLTPREESAPRASVTSACPMCLLTLTCTADMNRTCRPAASTRLLIQSIAGKWNPDPPQVPPAFRARRSDHNGPVKGMCPFPSLCSLKVSETMSLRLVLFLSPRKLRARFPGLAAVGGFDLGHVPRHRRPQPREPLSVPSQCQQPLGDQPSQRALGVRATSRIR